MAGLAEFTIATPRPLPVIVLADVSGSMGDGQTIDPESGFRIVRTYAFAFLEYVFGNDATLGILEGTDVVDAAAEVR